MKKSFINFFVIRNAIVVLADFLCLNAALLIGYLIWVTYPWSGKFQAFEEYARILWILPPLGILVFNAVDLYKSEVGIQGVEEQGLIFKAVWILYLIGLALSFFYRDVKFSRLATFYSFFVATVLISLERFLFRYLFQWSNERGIAVRQAIIYGAGYHGLRLARWIKQSPKLGIHIVGYLDDHLETLIKKDELSAWLGKLDDLPALVAKHNVEQLFIAHRKLPEEKTIEIFQKCRSLDVQCWTIPSLYQFHIERAQILNIGGIPLMGFRMNFGRTSYVAFKRFFDLIAASLAFVIAAPLMLTIALAMRLSNSGPIFFKQVRIGENGKSFVMYKFRTLKASSKDDISPELKKGEASFLPFGKFLRKTGLDELPQLINVLKGDMSLVGPRPEMPFIVNKYGPLEKERLTVKPGITGLWQISEDRKRLLIHENMDYDLYYIERLGFNLDLAILMKTVFIIFQRFF